MINFRMQILLSFGSWIRGKRCHFDAVAGDAPIYSLSEYSFIRELEYLFIGLKTHGLRRLPLMSFSWDGALQRISRIESAPSRILVDGVVSAMRSMWYESWAGAWSRSSAAVGIVPCVGGND